jgi:hypothetical protein
VAALVRNDLIAQVRTTCLTKADIACVHIYFPYQVASCGTVDALTKSAVKTSVGVRRPSDADFPLVRTGYMLDSRIPVRSTGSGIRI